MRDFMSLYRDQLALGLPDTYALRHARERYAAERGHSTETICTGSGTCVTCADLQEAYEEGLHVAKD